MSEETLEISFDEIEKERENLPVDTRDKSAQEYGMIPERFLFEQELKNRCRNWKGIKPLRTTLLYQRTFQPGR